MLECGWNAYAESFYANAEVGKERDPFYGMMIVTVAMVSTMAMAIVTEAA